MAIGMRKAIDAKCKDCIYDPSAGLGSWRQQTEGCTSTACPLYHLRPVSATGDTAQARKATFRANNPDWQPPRHLATARGLQSRERTQEGPSTAPSGGEQAAAE